MRPVWKGRMTSQPINKPVDILQAEILLIVTSHAYRIKSGEGGQVLNDKVVADIFLMPENGKCKIGVDSFKRIYIYLDQVCFLGPLGQRGLRLFPQRTEALPPPPRDAWWGLKIAIRFSPQDEDAFIAEAIAVR